MKRLCSRQEKELLFQNRKRFCNGVFASNASGFGRLLWALVVSFVLAVVVIICGDCFFEIRHMSAFTRLVFGLSFGVVGPVTAILYGILRVKRDKKRLLKSKEVFVNGATVVGVDYENKRLLYVEDDVYDENGSIILFAYPSDELEISKFSARERVLLIYDWEDSCHLMRMNTGVADYFRIGSGPVIREEEVMKTELIPHCNALKIERDERALSTAEKEKFSCIYAKLWGQAGAIFAAVIGAMFIGLVTWVSVLIGRDIGKLHQAVIIGLIISGVICVAVYVSYWVIQWHYRRKCHFVSIKEVMMNYFEYGENNIETIHVFEWEVNRLELKTYQKVNYSFSMRYGGILYKLKTSENDIVILSKDELRKKKMI